MTNQEFALRVLYALLDLVPVLAVGLAATVLAVVCLNVLGAKAWIRDRGFAVMGLFFGLDLRGRFRLASIWLRLVFVCYFLAAFRGMSTLHYWAVVVPGLLGAFLDVGLRKWVENLFWLGIQLLGLLSANMICRFVVDMAGGPVFLMIYIAIALFLVLLSVYLFLQELGSLSDHRKVDPREVWAREETESDIEAGD